MHAAAQAHHEASDTGLTLFHAAHSTCSQKVRLCLAEKGLGYESRILRIKQSEHLSPEYLALNPNGVVPTLTHHGRPVLDSSVICEYLDEVFAQPPLAPRDPFERARMRAWLRYLEEVPTAAIRVPSINLLFVPIIAALGDGHLSDVAERAPLRRDLYRRIGPQGFSEQETRASLDSLRASLHRADRALRNGPWLNGPDYSLADVVFTPILARLEDLGMTELWGDLGAVGDWYARITARPSFSQAFFPGSRILPHNPDMV